MHNAHLRHVANSTYHFRTTPSAGFQTSKNDHVREVYVKCSKEGLSEASVSPIKADQRGHAWRAGGQINGRRCMGRRAEMMLGPGPGPPRDGSRQLPLQQASVSF